MQSLFAGVCFLLCAGQAFAETSVLLLPVQSKGAVDTQRVTRAIEDALAREPGIKVMKAKKSHSHVLSCTASVDNRTLTLDFRYTHDANEERTQLVVAPTEDLTKKLRTEMARILGNESPDLPALQAVMPEKVKQQQSEELAVEPIAKKQRAEKRSRALLIAGVVVAAVGAAGMGTAAYFGSRSVALGGGVNAETPQISTERLQREANMNALGANLGFGVGGGLVALGAALIIADVVLDMQVTPSLSVSTTGASASLTVPF